MPDLTTAQRLALADLLGEAQRLLTEHGATLTALADILNGCDPEPLAERTITVDEVPADGSVDVRWFRHDGTWADWAHVTGVAPDYRPGYRRLFCDGADVIGPAYSVLHESVAVQVRPHVETDPDDGEPVFPVPDPEPYRMVPSDGPVQSGAVA